LLSCLHPPVGKLAALDVCACVLFQAALQLRACLSYCSHVHPPPLPGAPDGYGPTGLSEAQLDELLAAVTAHMDAAADADVTVVRRRKVGCRGEWRGDCK